jgi:hypothetical protein
MTGKEAMPEVLLASIPFDLCSGVGSLTLKSGSSGLFSHDIAIIAMLTMETIGLIKVSMDVIIGLLKIPPIAAVIELQPQA